MEYLTLAEVESIARRVHAGQQDKAGRPYIEHVAAVARGTEQRGGDEEQVAAAWLHDTVEDDVLSADWLAQAALSPRTKDIVRAMTRGPQEPLADYIGRVLAVPGAAIVKAADLADNSDPERLARLPGSVRARLCAKYAQMSRLLGLTRPGPAPLGCGTDGDPGDDELLAGLDPTRTGPWEVLRRHVAEDAPVRPDDLEPAAGGRGDENHRPDRRPPGPAHGPRTGAVIGALHAVGAVSAGYDWQRFADPAPGPDGRLAPADAVRTATAVLRREQAGEGTVARAWQDGRLYAVCRSLAEWYRGVPERQLAELLAADREGRRVKYLFFWGHRPSRDGGVGPGCLSQWWPSPFTADGVHYASAEHYMMAAKARLFGDADAEARILAARTPAEAKALGRRVAGFDEEAWAAHRFGIVVRGCLGKFGGHPELRAYLLRTGNRVLVEASPLDRVWGIGLAADDERAASPSSWRGRNLLGFALMTAREMLRTADGPDGPDGPRPA